MATKELVLFKLSDKATSAASAINITNAKLSAKAIQGATALTAKGLTNIGGMCVDYSGNIYVTDYVQHVIIKVTEAGKVNTVAGLAGTSGNNSALQNVVCTAARFNAPKGIACDKSGNLYVADSGNNQIRIIRNGKVGVFAGNGARTAGLVDAASNPLQAQFNNPTDVAVDNSGNVFVCDTGNHAIRRITGGKVLNIAGGATGSKENVKATNVPGANAIFASPTGVTVDVAGNVFVMDTGNRKIKKITPKGWVYLFSGSGSQGRSLGTGTEKAYTCTYEGLINIKTDRNGYVYLLDADSRSAESRLLKLTPNGIPSVVIDFSTATAADDGLQALAVTPAMKVIVGIIE